MRQILGKPILFIIVLLMVFTSSLPAMANESQIAFPVGKKVYSINGQGKTMDAQAFVSNGRTYIPLRYLGESLGAEVKWVSDGGNHGQIILVKGSNGVVFRLDRKEYTIIRGNNATSAQMDVAPVSRENRLYLPARYVAEVFGYQINFDTASNAVQIYPSTNQTPVTDAPEQKAPEMVKPDPSLVNGLLSTVLLLYSFMFY